MSQERPVTPDPRWVSKAKIKQLSQNFFKRLQVDDGNGHRPMCCDDPRDPKKNDTRSVYFKKTDLDALFAANPGSDGLKIYFGMHHPDIFNPGGTLDPNYHHKLMVVLVSTTNEVDNLHDKSDTEALALNGTGDGLDSGKLCPPYGNC
ncbi:hypothetical protein DYU05_19295 [Mucilaginibacter terrenus]|uniref:Uncharacterized protein n=1 Tax=Mucilaginibacter terrenus TaxID=2482727 RepID=A0A3E2NKC4_9SPHI|nr:hypothetical protein [Mucilaginibacter terrenus]RFZ81428.1 hypothetical protein DYU05_19295 [Mucilaginibacter terrenus]